VDGVPQAFSFDGLAMTISVQSEAGLIDLNAADETTIAGLFTAAGLAPDTAKTLAASVVDWREPVDGDDDPTRTRGTTDGQYASAGYMPRHNPFQTVDELKLVVGMTPALFARVAPVLTVYSREADVDEDVAPVAVLNALYPNDPAKVAQTINARTNPPPPTDPDATPAGPPGVIAQSDTSWGHSYLVTIAASPGGRHIVRSAVVEPTGNPDQPYLVEAWN
jgi:general secretion pathway protein K